MKRWNIWVAFASVFLAGAIVGVAGFGLFLKHHMKPPQDHEQFRAMMMDRLMDEIRDRVHPAEENLPFIRKEMETMFGKLEVLREEANPKVKAIFEEGHSRIRILLTQEQQERFDQMIDDLRHGRAGFLPPPPPPPM